MESGPLGLTWKSEETVCCTRTSQGVMLIKARFVHLREKLFHVHLRASLEALLVLQSLHVWSA